jgi:hypothetical protein
MRPSRKIETDNGVELWCPQCEEYLPEDYFYHNASTKYGRSSHCKQCCIRRQKERRAEDVGPQMSDREIVNIWLTKMGYDVNGEKSIHQQFLEKHPHLSEPKPKPTPTPKEKKRTRNDWTEEEWFLYRKRRNMEYLKKIENKKK